MTSILSVAGLVVAALAWQFAGAAGIAYLFVYLATLAPGLPIGFALFGRRHAAGWITGALCGYALTCLTLWIPIELGLAAAGWAVATWSFVTAVIWLLLRGHGPAVTLPAWGRRDTSALLLVVLVVPLLVARPFSRIGEPDSEGNLRYRAYFTADFLWHAALTAELSKGSADPRNPYLARRPLHYYWAYFVVPSLVMRHTPLMPSVVATLKVNAMCAGLLFVAALFVAAWCAVPRAPAAAAAVLLTIVASSAEGLYASLAAVTAGQPLSSLRHLNIDAITSWVFRSLTVDALPRSIWYTPQHAAACALGLMSLLVPVHSGRTVRPTATALAGLALGLALTFSPFLGGAFCVIYGVTALWTSLRTREDWMPSLMTHAAAAVPVILALGWCFANRTFDGAGGNVAFGVSQRAGSAPLTTVLLTLGPALALVPGAFILAKARHYRWEPSVVALATGLVMLFGVTLTAEPIWVGWRAGQIILVTVPALSAACLAGLWEKGLRTTSIALATLVLLAGLPTTVVDLYNAQDVGNLEMGPGFRWTVKVPPDSQAALTWLRERSPVDSVVQMSIKPRGRETWTLVPTFAERRLAAGQPISLLQIPEYAEESARADAIFSGRDAAEAARTARAMRIDYLYMDQVEREAFGSALDKFNTPEYFELAFQEGEAAVYRVR